MRARSLKIWPLTLLLAAGLFVQTTLRGQEAAPADAPPPPAPAGVEVMARGPVHEAFASLTAEPQPTQLVPKEPPQPLQEMPPEVKPAGDSLWIGGYWAWDDDRKDFLWVSGVWRTPPPNKQWVAGYWRQEGDNWQYVPGLWTEVAKQDAPQQVTYMPKPPDPPNIASPGAPPSPDTFYIPGHWEWNGSAYLWRGGYWARVQPDYVWVAAHYRWTPGGYIYIAGYWDYSVKRRGVLYAPVVIDSNVVTAGFVYTPAYAVPDAVLVDALFVRPARCSYYFGDYYDDSYRSAGFTSCVVYSRSNYDSIIVYERYEHREEPNWINIQINLSNDRFAGRAPVPARTLNQQTTIIQNTTVVNNITNNSTTNITNNTNNVTVNRTVMKTPVLAPPAQVMAAKGVQPVKLDRATRVAAQQQAVAVQQVAVQRSRNEVAAPGGAPKQPRVASITAPRPQPVAPKSAAAPAANASRPAATTPAVHQSVSPAATAGPAKPATTPITAAAPKAAPVAPFSPQAATAPRTAPTVAPTAPYSPQTTRPAAPLMTTVPPPTSPATTRLATPPPGSSLLKPATTQPPTRPAPYPPSKGPPPKDKDKDNQH